MQNNFWLLFQEVLAKDNRLTVEERFAIPNNPESYADESLSSW